MTKQDSKIVCLVGATGTGKSDAGIFLARAFNGVILNFDSRQVYRDIPIVTAQPSGQEQALCPHLLYGFLGSDVAVRAGSFAAHLEREIDAVLKSGRLPILVGGTGLYLQTFVKGLAPIPPVPSAVRQEVEQMWTEYGGHELHVCLQAVDPVYAAKIHPNDRQRLCRAMEVYLVTKKPFSAWHSQQVQPAAFDVLQIGLWQDLAELTPRLGIRIEKMLELGARTEMERAFARCEQRTAPAFDSIGCRELLAWILEECSEKECRELWLKNTRAYAKRQITWFKKDKEIIWLPPGNRTDLYRLCAEFVEKGK